MLIQKLRDVKISFLNWWHGLQEVWQPGYSWDYRQYRLREAFGLLFELEEEIKVGQVWHSKKCSDTYTISRFDYDSQGNVWWAYAIGTESREEEMFGLVFRTPGNRFISDGWSRSWKLKG